VVKIDCVQRANFQKAQHSKRIGVEGAYLDEVILVWIKSFYEEKNKQGVAKSSLLYRPIPLNIHIL